jgi:hypothetical protein
MTAPSPRRESAFEELMSVMPSIAEMVNKFASEDNQRTAFGILLRAHGLPEQPPALTGPREPGLSVVPPLNGDSAEGHDAEEGGPSAAHSPSVSGRRRSAKKRSSARPLDVQFRPDGKPSLVDFAAEKTPVSIAERSAVVVYYLLEMLKFEAIEPGHVLAGFRECNWPDPSPSIDQALRVVASKKHYIVTSDMKNITLTSAGRNLINFHLPKKTNEPA